MNDFLRYGALWRLRNRAVQFFFASIAAVFVLSGGAAPGETKRVTFLGDSLVQGYGLQVEAGLVPQLETWLRAEGHDVALLNAGVSGDTTQGGANRIEWTLSDSPDALLVALGGNDVLRGIDPAVAEANMRVIMEAARGADVPVMLFGFDAPSNYGPAYKDAFDGLYGRLAEEFDATLHVGLFAALEGIAPVDLPGWMQGDMIHPNPRGVSRIVEFVGPDVAQFLTDLQAGS